MNTTSFHTRLSHIWDQKLTMVAESQMIKIKHWCLKSFKHILDQKPLKIIMHILHQESIIHLLLRIKHLILNILNHYHLILNQKLLDFMIMLISQMLKTKQDSYWRMFNLFNQEKLQVEVNQEKRWLMKLPYLCKKKIHQFMI